MECDYLIIGAGPAGCVLAHRLTEDPDIRVILAEAGPRDWHPYIHIPATCFFLQQDTRFNWRYQGQPVPQLNGRVITYSQGKVLGGSGSINGMLHVRGQPAEYDLWAQQGCKGWSYDDVLPYFIKAEGFADGNPAWRGSKGPLGVSRQQNVHPLSQAFLDAAEGLGFARNEDMNGPHREGAALFQQNRRGRFRANPAQTYLRQARRRLNLTVLTETPCQRIILREGRATGAMFKTGEGELTISARREVLLCAGAIKSPQILMHSGIGDPEHLSRHGIEVRHASPMVGQNLRDHFLIRIKHGVRGQITINERTRGTRAIVEALRYAAFGRGLLTSGAGAAALFFKTRPELAYPNAQLSFTPGSFASPGVLDSHPGMSIGAWPSYPESKGRIALAGPEPDRAPEIHPEYLSAVEDRDNIVASLRMARRILRSPHMARWSTGEILPGREVETDEEMIGFARQYGISGLHLVGTCAMGGRPDDVTDPALKVRGVRALRVIDASVMPQCPSGNALAPIVMMAERASDLIKAHRHTSNL